MGKYDNCNNSFRIKRAQKKYDKLRKKRKPDLFLIDRAKEELDNELLFSSCQIFGSKNPYFCSEYDPNLKILFNDDRKLMMFGNIVIPYSQITVAQFEQAKKQIIDTGVNSIRALSGALMGKAVAGDIGAFVGAVSAIESRSYQIDGDLLYVIYTKDNHGRWIVVNNSNEQRKRIPKKWRQLHQKVEMIIAESKSEKR
ncbi:MAG: hypothetical protein Q4B26_15765 [Eubacteriales bacterium]|nr:hypothetical protein [Eubacteriales bacterium]